MREFLSDLRSVLGLGALKRVGRKAWEDDCPGLAAQLAYFSLLTLFPLLMLLAAVAGLVVDDPGSLLRIMAERVGAFLPVEAVGLLADYVERTLRGNPAGALLFAVLILLGSGSAASQAVVKAADRAYGVRETRPLWRLWGISVVMILGLALLVGALVVAALGPEAGRYAQKLAGLPETSPIPWAAIRWVAAFFAVTLALAVLYYLAPNADVPFAWITPGGLAATVLMLGSSAALSVYVSNVGRYDQVYGQLGAVVVLMLWLYVTGLAVLLGAEANAVLARMAEERKGEKLVRPQGPEDEAGV